MIIQNIFGVIGIILSLLIFATLFNNMLDNNSLTSQIKILNDISNQLESICLSPYNKIGYPIKLRIINEDYLIRVNGNTICLNASDNSLICNKLKCDLKANSQIIIQNSKFNFTNNLVDICFLEKLNQTLILINCTKEYNY